jgi:hypothetical protein
LFEHIADRTTGELDLIAISSAIETHHEPVANKLIIPYPLNINEGFKGSTALRERTATHHG